MMDYVGLQATIITYAARAETIHSLYGRCHRLRMVDLTVRYLSFLFVLILVSAVAGILNNSRVIVFGLAG
jgi:hypothetical protein